MKFLSAFILFFSFSLFAASLRAQPLTWDGGGGDSLWTTAANWSTDRVPDSLDDVILSNTTVPGSYRVSLPSGNYSALLRSLQIVPDMPNRIELVIPLANTAAPALTTSAAPGIWLAAGAVLRNGSGAPSGNVVVTADSLRILSGGYFIQQSETGHASLLNRLARAPQTAGGTFEFNVPGNASYTVSVSNRNYGNLVLSAEAAGGSKTYLSSGTNPLRVRGQCTIKAGVVYAMNFSGGLQIEGDLEVQGVFNLSSGAATNTLRLNGNWRGSGTLTETGTGTARLVMTGQSDQQIHFSGSFLQQLELVIQSAGRVQLFQPLTLTHRLVLQQGVLQTDAVHLLTLDSTCVLQADSAAPGVYIDGPLQRRGLREAENYLFPVGKGGRQRWVQVQGTVGSLTAEYQRRSAAELSVLLDSALHHVSSLEYWELSASTADTVLVTLSFDGVNSGGVTELQSLRVARLQAAEWRDAGNTGISGSAGASGSVRSVSMADLGNGLHYFTLASGTAAQNPLPLYPVILHHLLEGNKVKLVARAQGWEPSALQFEYSDNGTFFQPLTVAVQRSQSAPSTYSATDEGPRFNYRFYRVRAFSETAGNRYSHILRVSLADPSLRIIRGWPQPAGDNIRLELDLPASGIVDFKVLDNNGLCVRLHRVWLPAGNPSISLPLEGLRAGHYHIVAVSFGRTSNLLRLIHF